MHRGTAKARFGPGLGLSCQRAVRLAMIEYIPKMHKNILHCKRVGGRGEVGAHAYTTSGTAVSRLANATRKRGARRRFPLVILMSDWHGRVVGSSRAVAACVLLCRESGSCFLVFWLIGWPCCRLWVGHWWLMRCELVVRVQRTAGNKGRLKATGLGCCCLRWPPAANTFCCCCSSCC